MSEFVPTHHYVKEDECACGVKLGSPVMRIGDSRYDGCGIYCGADFNDQHLLDNCMEKI